MSNSKIHNRLSKLEQSSKLQHVDYIFVPAINGETDLDAIEKRFYKPFFANYKILVFRRSDNGFTAKLYDEERDVIDDNYIVILPDKELYSCEGYILTPSDKQTLIDYFDCKLRKTESN